MVPLRLTRPQKTGDGPVQSATMTRVFGGQNVDGRARTVDSPSKSVDSGVGCAVENVSTTWGQSGGIGGQPDNDKAVTWTNVDNS
ncbi:MAG: hypothetical protein ACI867_001331 [Glaciecola sp.]|jgi:hypothetical protein